MSMITKDHETIAQAIYKAVIDEGSMDELRTVASHLANSLQLDSSEFDRKKFLADCGVTA